MHLSFNVRNVGVMPEQLSKFCPDCGEERPASEFYRFKKNGGYLFPRCKKHSNKLTAQYYRDNPDKKRGANLRKNYKLSHEEYERLLITVIKAAK